MKDKCPDNSCSHIWFSHKGDKITHTSSESEPLSDKCVCVCVCERESEREKVRGKEREGTRVFTLNTPKLL